MIAFRLLLFPCLLLICSFEIAAQKNSAWMMRPFRKADEANPILSPRSETTFDCPMRNSKIKWEANHVFNPAAVVYKNQVYLLYRAEDSTGEGIGGHTSRIGLAVSRDGFHFTRRPAPVIYPQDDISKAYEWDGGCEDPRIVEAPDSSFVVTYTMWDRKLARIGIATSKDLVHWTKHGSAFEAAAGGKYKEIWSKSGSVITAWKDNRLVAQKINNRYWMYYGEGSINIATSPDLINWTPVVDAHGDLVTLFTTRSGRFDSDLVEPGPPAVVTKNGILFIYNGKNSSTTGDSSLPANTYAGGQALMDANDPTIVIDRSNNCFIKPEKPYELTGQYVAGTVFLEGLVFFKNKWFIYYGTADSKVAAAVYVPGSK